MPTDRELMQQALDALEEAKEDVMDWGQYASEYFQEKHNLYADATKNAALIEDLRARLAQPEPAAYDKSAMNRFVQDLYEQKLREGKHGLYETLFYVVHEAIKLKEKNA